MHECTKIDALCEIKKDIDTLFIIKDIVIELKTLVSVISSQNKKHEEILNQQSLLIVKLTESNNQQSEVLKTLINKYDSLDDRIEQKNLENLKDGSISFNNIFRMIIDKALPPIILGGIIYLVLEIVNKK